MSADPKDPFASIDLAALEKVAGGASRSSSNDQLTAMLTQITSSIQDLASQKNNSSADPMQMMLIMLMMGGMGGGGGGGYVAAAPGATHQAPVINVDTSVSGGGGGRCFPKLGCGKRGKKGW